MAVARSHFGSGLLRRLAMNAASLAAGGLVAQGCLLVVEALIARRLGRHDYGIASSIIAVSMVSVYFFELGMAPKLVQDGSRDPQAIPTLLGTTIVLKLLLAALVYAVLLLALPRIGYEPTAVGYFAIFFGYAVLVALQDTLAAVNTSRLQMHRSAAYQASTPLLVLVLVAIVTARSESLLAVGWCYALGGLAVTLVWGWQIFRDEHPRVALRSSGAILRGSYLYGTTGALFQVSFRIEVVLLSLLRDVAEAGLFAAANRITEVGMKVAILGARVTAPVLFHQSAHDRAAYVRSCKLVVRTAAILGAAAGLTLAILAEPLMTGLFGAAFGVSSLVLMVLAPSIAARFAMAALGQILSSSELHGRRTAALGGSVAMAAAANLALIPPFGVIGAAVARLLGDAVQVAVVATARTGLPRGALLGWLGLPLLLGAGAYAAAVALAEHPGARLPLALLVLAAALLGTRAVRLGEVRELLRAVSAGRRSRAELG